MAVMTTAEAWPDGARPLTVADAWPGYGQPFTVANLERMPDDGRRYELLDGALIVSPRPTPIHQAVAARLLVALSRGCPDDLIVMAEPAVELDMDTEFDPDLVVVHLDEVSYANFSVPPLLVVEVRSPSTAVIDLGRKKAAYERFGVPSYWIVNPGPERPEVTVFELRDGRYETVEKATETFMVSQPFPVTITPTDLTRGISRQPRS